MGPDGRVLRTFEDIEQESRVIADLLDFPAGRCVTLDVPNHASWPACCLAVWKRGLILVPLDGGLTAEAKNLREKNCGAVGRLSLSQDRVELTPLDHGSMDGLAKCGAVLLKTTSGTSGVPRFLFFTASQMKADCVNVCLSMGITKDDLNYGAISFAHSYGFSNLITPLLLRGVPMVCADDMFPASVSEGCRRSGATVFPGVPAVFHALAESEGDLGNVRLCISAGAPLPSVTGRRFHARHGLKIHNFYGASECGGICYDGSEDLDVPPGFVGEALQNVCLKFPDGENEGTLEVHSAAVGSGWIDGSGLHFFDGPYRPPDVLRREGNGWRIVGRQTDMINAGGRKLHPSTVEEVMAECPGVSEVVVLGVEAGARGQEIVALVAGDASDQVLRKHAAEHLATWQIPRRWVRVAEIPRNVRGKISRAELIARLGLAEG